jgi:hypothetical protein
MKITATLQKLMIAAGLLAALTIAVSPAFEQETAKAMSEIKAQANPDDDGAMIAAVSTDALTSSQAVEVESANPFIVQEVIVVREHPMPVSAPEIIPASALTTLLKSTISPQAP